MLDKNAVRTQLLALKKEAEEKLEKTQGHIRHATGPVSKSFDEQASERSNDDVVYNLDELTRSELIEIETALEKIDKNEYGLCNKCGSEIEKERLKAIPYTSVCKNCANDL